MYTAILITFVLTAAAAALLTRLYYSKLVAQLHTSRDAALNQAERLRTEANGAWAEANKIKGTAAHHLYLLLQAGRTDAAKVKTFVESLPKKLKAAIRRTL